MAVEDQTPDEPVQPGVFVSVVDIGDGKHGQVGYQIVGSLDPLAVPYMLEMAYHASRAHLGLPKIR